MHRIRAEKETKVLIALIITFIGACSQQNSAPDRRVIYTLPASYIGTFYIIIVPQNMKAKDFRKYDIPPSGVLIVKKPLNEGWDSEGIIEFFYRNNDEIEEITGRVGRAVKDTPKSRADPEVKIFGTSVGEYEGIHADCVILFRSYYIGTNADAYDSVNFFDIDDYIKENSIDCKGMEPGTLRKQHLATQEKRQSSNSK